MFNYHALTSADVKGLSSCIQPEDVCALLSFIQEIPRNSMLLFTPFIIVSVLIISFCCVQMVGIGTSDVNLDKYRHTFCSLLGKDAESWGLSYTGRTEDGRPY